jgi:hypothetical protein
VLQADVNGDGFADFEIQLNNITAITDPQAATAFKL